MPHVGLNAHLLSSQAGYRAAGIHNVIHRLLLHLPQVAPQGWRFSALVGREVRAEYPAVAVRRSRLNTEHPLQRILWEQAAQPWQLSEFDLLHATAFVSPVLALKPTVVTVYDLSFMRYPSYLPTARRLYLRLLTAWSCQRARRVTVISQSTADDLTALLGIPADKIDVTLLGYDRAQHYPRAAAEVAAFRAQKGLPDRFWLFVGTIEPRKNLPLLLDAYAALPRTERLPLLLGGGRGWGQAEVEAKIAEHGLAGDVRLIGFVPVADLPLWYNAAEVFVYPSVFEGFGLPVLEAMACGTPVLTSNVSSLPEVAQDVGLCLPPHDRAAWVEGLRRAFYDADWREQARARGLQAARRFTWEQTARDTLHSYQKALQAVPMRDR
ncbi:glycosyltransferase family 1 protein [Aggregatilineales bacterium SYSU G02658]